MSRATVYLAAVLTTALAGGAGATPQRPLIAEDELRKLSASADRGDPNAQFALGVIDETGNGVFQDLVEGYVWLDLCARHVETGDEQQIAAWDAQSGNAATTAACAEARNQLRNKLTPEQTSEADRRVLELMASYEKPPR